MIPYSEKLKLLYITVNGELISESKDIHDANEILMNYRGSGILRIIDRYGHIIYEERGEENMDELAIGFINTLPATVVAAICERAEAELTINDGHIEDIEFGCLIKSRVRL